MVAQRIYLLHPNELINPSIPEWIGEVLLAMGSDTELGNWELIRFKCDDNCSVRINDVCSAVIEIPGPIICVKPIQKRVTEELKKRLGDRAVIRIIQPGDPVDIYAMLEEVHQLHEKGEPLIPRKFVLALLIMHKLHTQLKWAGNNKKGFMWAMDIPKGRGVAEEFGDQVPQVINDLFTEGILIQKVSQGRKKYALNPDRRKEIFGILRDRNFGNLRLAEILNNDSQQCSARYLDEFPDYSNER